MLLNSISDFLFIDVENKLLFKNDYLLPSIMIGYIIFATWIGPSLMETFKPFNLQKIMVAYNFFEVAVNAYIFQWIFSAMLECRHTHCLPHDDPRYLSDYKDILEFHIQIWREGWKGKERDPHQPGLPEGRPGYGGIWGLDFKFLAFSICQFRMVISEFISWIAGMYFDPGDSHRPLSQIKNFLTLFTVAHLDLALRRGLMED
ncbi:hypothetical protein AVEN_160111-1 [Araneus ventricosus]|uniref:Uncharacterized protein n=1 Tax=Araneus ventricosus TaxID=182803 RepID=A0A4Y2GG91_ARAVE|nr:hypothetical protein AVEN_160111-1 [Araneus ventricosus]